MTNSNLWGKKRSWLGRLRVRVCTLETYINRIDEGSKVEASRPSRLVPQCLSYMFLFWRVQITTGILNESDMSKITY